MDKNYLRLEQVNTINDTNAIANALEDSGIKINFISSSLYFRTSSASSCTIFTKSNEGNKYITIGIYEIKDRKIHVSIRYYNYDSVEYAPEYKAIFSIISDIFFNRYGSFNNLKQLVTAEPQYITLDFTY